VQKLLQAHCIDATNPDVMNTQESGQLYTIRYCRRECENCTPHLRMWPIT